MKTEDKIESYKNRIERINQEIFYLKETVDVKEYNIKILMEKIKCFEKELANEEKKNEWKTK